jgi:hypothetical protein
MGEKLFNAFPPATREQWEAVVKKELKDKDPSTLAVKVDGLVLSPFHVAEGGLPTGDRRRGVKRSDNGWRAGVEVGPSEERANARLLEALMGGADAVQVTGDDMTGLPELLKDVMLGAIDLQVSSGTPAVLNWLLKEAQRQGAPASELSLFVRLPFDTTELFGVNELLRGYPRVRLFEVDDQQHGTTSTKSAIERGRERL